MGVGYTGGSCEADFTVQIENTFLRGRKMA